MYKLIFLCPENFEQASLAESHFNSECARMELPWQSTATMLSQQELDSKQLQKPCQTEIHSVVALALDEHQSSVKGLYKSENLEFWTGITAENPDIIKSKINDYLIRLILKGGKRQGVQKELVCVKCNKVASACSCFSKKGTEKAKAVKAPAEIIRVTLERKGRGGKTVTVASGFSLNEAALQDLVTELKKACGSGGTMKDETIEIQGDHRIKLMAELDRRGYKTKRVGS